MTHPAKDERINWICSFLYFRLFFHHSARFDSVNFPFQCDEKKGNFIFHVNMHTYGYIRVSLFPLGQRYLYAMWFSRIRSSCKNNIVHKHSVFFFLLSHLCSIENISWMSHSFYCVIFYYFFPFLSNFSLFGPVCSVSF